MFRVSVMSLCSGPKLTCYIYIMSSGVYLSHTRQFMLGLLWAALPELFWSVKKGAYNRMDTAPHKFNHISATRGSAKHMDNYACLSAHKAKRKHHSFWLFCFLWAVCSCCQWCTDLWSPRPERSQLPNLPYIYIPSQRYIRWNTSVPIIKVLTNLWHFPISSYCFKSDERLCCHLAYNWR